MAEEQGDAAFENEFEEGMGSKQKPRKKYQINYEECNIRLDELSKPRRWYLLSTYQENVNRFDEKRLEKMRARIQEEFSLSPEETEKYMERFKKKVKTDIRKLELRKERNRQKKLAKRKAYLLFRKYIKRGMMFACQNSPPTIVSPVVNSVSDAILKILCEIHNINPPPRRNNDRVSQFLIANADWLAIAVCRIYYEIQIEQQLEIEKQQELERRLAIEKAQESKPTDAEGATENADEELEDEELRMYEEFVGKEEAKQGEEAEDLQADADAEAEFE